MRLLIVSATPHYWRGSQIVGHGATVREIDHLCQLFDQITHIGFLYDNPPPDSALPYQSPDVRFIGLQPTGGDSLIAKARILLHFPGYARTILRQLSQHEMVHVRCPANVSLLAIVLLAFLRQPTLRWIKYAGNWKPSEAEAWSYTFQRWWLSRNLPRARVTVNGAWPDQPSHVFSFDNPCLTKEELVEGRHMAQPKHLREQVNMLYAGRLEAKKGLLIALQVIAQLRQRGYKLHYDIVGAGPQLTDLTMRINALGLQEVVTIHNPVTRHDLNSFYTRAHFVFFPTSSSEGWPKVLSEGMAYGAVPIVGNVGSIPAYLNQIGSGCALPADDIDGFVNAIAGYLDNPRQWRIESLRGLGAAERFSYAAYLERVRALMYREAPA